MANLPDIELDPRNELELWEQAANHAFNRSGGLLSAFHPGDPLSVLLEGQVYAGAELLWYLNKLPSRLLSYWLAGYGLSAAEGTKAVGQLTINFSPLPTAITIPAGSRFSSGTEVYQTISQTVVGVGLSEITISVEAIEVGARYNVPPFSIRSIITPIPYSRSCYNTAPITGGSDNQTPEQLIAAFVQDHFDGTVVSATDIERAAKRYLGDGWVVRLSINEDPSTGLPAQGTIAVLVDNPEYASVPTGVLAGLQNYLNSVCPVNFSPWCSDLKRQLLDIKIWIRHANNMDPKMVSDNIYSQMLELVDLPYLDDRSLAPLAFRAGGTFESLSINGVPSVTRRSNSRLHLRYLEVIAVDDDGIQSIHIYGNGDED